MVDVAKRLHGCFSVVFPDLSPNEIPRASQVSLASWDSLASVTLVAVVEEEFRIDISEQEFEEMTSFAQVLELVTVKVARD